MMNEACMKEYKKRKGFLDSLPRELNRDTDRYNFFAKAFQQGFDIGFKAAEDIIQERLAMTMVMSGFNTSEIMQLTGYPSIYIESLQREKELNKQKVNYE